MLKIIGERKIRSLSFRIRNGKRKRIGIEKIKSLKIRRLKEYEKVKFLLSNLLSKKNFVFEIFFNVVLKEKIKDW